MATPLPIFIAQLSVSIKAFNPVMARITTKAGDQIANQSIRNAPKITGSLRRSIKSHPARKGLGEITVQVSAGGPSSPHDVDYAVFVHEGTSRMGPNPFMRKAFNKVIPQWEKEVADVAELLSAGRPGRVAGSIAR